MASPWPHRAAVALVWFTFPLIWIGGLVTTTQSGMAVHDWPTTFGYNMFLYPIEEWISGPFGVFIEHGHRLFGSLVGLVTIAVCVALWKGDDRRWVRWLGVAALLAVVVQGLMGGMRVRFDAQTLALVHGSFAQAFFGLTVVLSVVTSRDWREPAWSADDPRQSAVKGFARAAAVTTAAVLVQILLGGGLRHFKVGAVPHVFMAVVVAGHVLWLSAWAWKDFRGDRRLFRPAMAMLALLLVQVSLGLAAWMTSRGWPTWLMSWEAAEGYVVTAGSRAQVWSATAHVAVGALMLAASVWTTMRAVRRTEIGRRPELINRNACRVDEPALSHGATA